VNKKGKLYLIPVPISEHDLVGQIPPQNLTIVNGLRHFIVENAKTARRFLKSFGYPDISQAQMEELNVKSDERSIEFLLKPLLEGVNIGLMSDAGAPAIADPGSDLLNLAYSKNIEVVPLAGPSAIMMAISASGFNGQNFAFTGYLPQDRPKREKRIKELESLAKKQKQAQFFIETPYRNIQMIESLLNALSMETKVFIAAGLLDNTPFVKSLSVAEWRKFKFPDLNRIPAVYGIY
jgi:16S rRNA (cytidine1402-2'-O)-methyltransferase